jgi:hypothetical protein
MPARPSTFAQPNPRVPVMAPKMHARTTVCQAEMYRDRIPGPGARAWEQKAARRGIPQGPTIDQVSCICRLCRRSSSAIAFTCKIQFTSHLFH